MSLVLTAILLLLGQGPDAQPSGASGVTPLPHGWVTFETFCRDCRFVSFHDRVSGALVTVTSYASASGCLFTASEETVWREAWSTAGIAVCLAKDARTAVVERVSRDVGELTEYNLERLKPSLPPAGCSYLEASSSAPALLHFSAAICGDSQRQRVEELIRLTRRLPSTKGAERSTTWRGLQAVRLGDPLEKVLRNAGPPQRAQKVENETLRLEYDVDGGPTQCPRVVVELSRSQVVQGLSCTSW